MDRKRPGIRLREAAGFLLLTALALMLQKRVLRNAVTATFEQNRDYEAVSQIFASQTDDCREGLTAALERRRPEFKGK